MSSVWLFSSFLMDWEEAGDLLRLSMIMSAILRRLSGVLLIKETAFFLVSCKPSKLSLVLSSTLSLLDCLPLWVERFRSLFLCMRV